MIVKRIITGELEENCYIIEINDECIIVDPGDDYEKIKEKISKKIVGIFITHHHHDHIGALETLKNDYDYEIPVYECKNLKESTYNISSFNFEVIYTKGHSDDSITFYFPNEKVMFTGDFLFKDNIGRCDMPGGSVKQMNDSIEKIKKYSDDIVIYPGHGDKTTLKHEKSNNYYFNYNWR